MKKAFLFLTMCFVLCGLTMMSCSKDNKKKKKYDASTVTVLVDGTSKDSLLLISNQEINLEAVFADKDGNPLNGYSTVWSCTDGLGAFSSQISGNTTFTATTAGTYNNAYIMATCVVQNGEPISKKVTVTLQEFVIEMEASTLHHDIPISQNPNVRVRSIRTDIDVSNVTIQWSTMDGRGSFSPSTTSVGEWTEFNALGLPGTANIVATVMGFGKSVPLDLTFVSD